MLEAKTVRPFVHFLEQPDGYEAIFVCQLELLVPVENYAQGLRTLEKDQYLFEVDGLVLRYPYEVAEPLSCAQDYTHIEAPQKPSRQDMIDQLKRLLKDRVKSTETVHSIINGLGISLDEVA